MKAQIQRVYDENFVVYGADKIGTTSSGRRHPRLNGMSLGRRAAAAGVRTTGPEGDRPAISSSGTHREGPNRLGSRT